MYFFAVTLVIRNKVYDIDKCTSTNINGAFPPKGNFEQLLYYLNVSFCCLE